MEFKNLLGREKICNLLEYYNNKLIKDMFQFQKKFSMINSSIGRQPLEMKCYKSEKSQIKNTKIIPYFEKLLRYKYERKYIFLQHFMENTEF